MKNNELRFEKANFEDLGEIANIEGEFFSDYSKVFSKEFLEKWYLYNSDMFYVVKDCNNKVFAFTILTPITNDLYNKILLGMENDMYDFSYSDVLKTMDSDYYYVSDMCVSKKNAGKNYFKAVAFLVGGAIKILSEKATYVTTTAITDEGLKLCKHIGFREVSYFNDDNYYICELLITDERKKRFSKLTKLVKEKK